MYVQHSPNFNQILSSRLIFRVRFLVQFRFSFRFSIFMFIPTIYNIQLNITFKISLLYKQNENYINGKIYLHGCADQVLVTYYREKKKRDIEREEARGKRRT